MVNSCLGRDKAPGCGHTALTPKTISYNQVGPCRLVAATTLHTTHKRISTQGVLTPESFPATMAGLLSKAVSQTYSLLVALDK